MGQLLYGKYPSQAALVDNLRDAGCSKGQIEEFLAYFAQGKTGCQLSLLEEHRRRLLCRLHREERWIDCLDYLIYQIQRDGRQGDER